MVSGAPVPDDAIQLYERIPAVKESRVDPNVSLPYFHCFFSTRRQKKYAGAGSGALSRQKQRCHEQEPAIQCSLNSSV